ncbi:signal peptidase I [Paramicrobacterium agarici]|uniref:Signal peptidase I n=1 Tax=Paramicrobacterium agarici TaxID=630514 RepID=A0A2A9DRJ7_9MICO|nr:signal peptidase I [Microbacterium agarici]PFG29407.1 signal peptidase [Microbacterium agarici]
MTDTRHEVHRPGGQERHAGLPGPLRRSLKLAASIAVWIAFFAVMAIVAVTLVIPRLVGAVPLAVLTSSMEPTMPPGTLVVSKPVDPASLAVGDVVTFQPVSDDPKLVTHRIVSQGHRANGALSFITRGDNNGADDKPIVAEQVMGKVIYAVPYVGHATSLLAVDERGWIVGALGSILIGYAVFTIMRELLRKRTERT